MATISISIPDDYLSTIAAAVREGYADAAPSLTDNEALRHAAKAHLKDLTMRYGQRHADSQAVSDAEDAQAAAELARATAAQVRKDAETAALSNVEDRFQEVN